MSAIQFCFHFWCRACGAIFFVFFFIIKRERERQDRRDQQQCQTNNVKRFRHNNQFQSKYSDWFGQICMVRTHRTKNLFIHIAFWKDIDAKMLPILFWIFCHAFFSWFLNLEIAFFSMGISRDFFYLYDCFSVGCFFKEWKLSFQLNNDDKTNLMASSRW